MLITNAVKYSKCSGNKKGNALIFREILRAKGLQEFCHSKHVQVLPVRWPTVGVVSNR